jgi:LacI family transcriptional regulator
MDDLVTLRCRDGSPQEFDAGLHLRAPFPDDGGHRSSARRRPGSLDRAARPATRRVALMFDSGRAYDVKVMMGVASYFRDQGNRHSAFIDDGRSRKQRLSDPRSWQEHGVIANFDDPGVAQAVARSGLPAVAFGSGGEGAGSSIPYFSPDNRLIASEAVNHLLEHGFKHLAFCGAPAVIDRAAAGRWPDQRAHAFADLARMHGHEASVFDPGAPPDERAGRQAAIRAWLRSMPKPLGIMAASDAIAREVLEACRLCGFRLPHDVAVIGVGNDELLCHLSAPALTSVDPGAARLGYEAAATLDRLLDGQVVDRLRVAVSPAGVIQRMSTDVIANGDPEVVKAMKFIREHASIGLNVPDVVGATATSRSTLEGRFRTILNCTIREAIRRAHLDRARRLVTETTLPLKQISAESGFKTVQHMTNCFVKTLGQTPGKYRSRSQP